uniref:BHLH domain-containing protein n=1 Tax=Schistosoma mansoni TaxID=6183 RepID=A0A5K4FD32_SCHMA
MSRNRIRNLSPIQRKLLTKRCQSTFKLLSGLNKNIRKRTCLKRLNGNSSLKPHQIECERLKEILPTVANCENLDEVKIIQEAIKHINYLEQAVLQRLNIINVETPIENSNLHSSSLSSSSLLPAFIFKLLSSQNNQSQSISEENLLFHTNNSYHNISQLDTNYITDHNFLSKSYEYLNSNGSTPYQTDDDIDQLG